MIYALIMTEGTDEREFLKVLLEKGLLKFKQEELLYETIYHKRQFDNELIAAIQQLGKDDQVDIYRVGDKLSDKLVIPNDFTKYAPNRIRSIHDVIISPEFEMLMIINEGKYKDYLKVKSKKKPSKYYESLHKDYHKQTKYIREYFAKMSNGQIKDLADEYSQKRIRTLKEGQMSINSIII